MFDIVVSHPKLSPAEFITEHTEFFLENVMLAYIRVGNIAKLKAILEKHVPEFLCVKYTNTLEMLDFVMNLSSVSIDAAAFVLQCCKKNNVTMLLALDEKLSLNSATVAATILQSPNFDSIILDDKIPASWREAFVRLFSTIDQNLCLHAMASFNELIESGGLEVSDNEKEEARLVCAVSTGKAESVEYKNRALRIVFERCDVEAVKALLLILTLIRFAWPTARFFLQRRKKISFLSWISFYIPGQAPSRVSYSY
ncbi:hypothetical protein BC829DRAFT_177188 [Chytridium lagenaria]|nr:hypothetical protein BC829DRAFT_177188 [Chytridium lagenaria]